jgi:hypothetical protein
VLNSKVVKFVENWKADGFPAQEGFNWTASRDNWIKAFPQESEFICSLQDEIDREAVRRVCQESRHNIREKFLSVMIWGYGDRGYGPYRVTQMLNQVHTEEVLARVFQICQSSDPKGAYDFLRRNRVPILGPSYGSKFINFCTPREVGAPIFDSLISKWIDMFAKEEFSNVSTSSENWNLKTYSKYWDWVKEHSDELNCYPDEIELAIFRDAENKFSKSSNWSGK